MKSNELSLNRLTEGQSVPRPHFGDASIVFDSDGVFKYIDGDDGAMKFIYPPANILFLYPEAKLYASGSSIAFNQGSVGTILDFKILGPYLEQFVLASSTTTITILKNVNLLTEVKNVGTGAAITIGSLRSAALLNQFFTDLPPTTKTATIDARFGPGSATCDPSIATAKGYIVNR